MQIIINERQERLLMESIGSEQMKDDVQTVNSEKQELENYIESKGEYMTDITNGKVYLVQYLKTLSDLVGNEYAMCAPVRKDGTYGAFYVKPYATFRRNSRFSGDGSKGGQRKPIPNLYRQFKLGEE